MLRNISQAIHPAMDVDARQPRCPVGRISLLAFLLVPALFEHQSEVASAASFRVDDVSLTVPALLADDWRAVNLRSKWTRSTGDAIPGEPQFVRFLAREYVFQLSTGGLRLKTTWFAARKCVSTDEAVSSLRGSKRAAIETAFGSLDDMKVRLQGDTSNGKEGRIVIWAQFQSNPDESLPIDALAAKDQEILLPFAELAMQNFETRVFSSSSCSENEHPSAARKTARSGGRRMPASRSQSRSRSRSKSAGGRALPGGVIPGAILQEAGSAYTGEGQRIVRGSNPEADDQRWGFLISQYVAKPGSLTFELVGTFTQCVRARTMQEAFAGMRARYRPSVAAAGGKRTSYVVEPSTSAACQNAADNNGAGGNADANVDNTGADDSSATGGNGGGTGGGGATGLPGGNGPLTPSPDPLNGDPSSGEDGKEGLDDFDLESIPASDIFSPGSDIFGDPLFGAGSEATAP